MRYMYLPQQTLQKLFHYSEYNQVMNIFERKHRTNNNKQIIILFDVDFISDGQLLQLFECITQTKSNSSNCNSKKTKNNFCPG
jgi:hypothetical protein